MIRFSLSFAVLFLFSCSRAVNESPRQGADASSFGGEVDVIRPGEVLDSLDEVPLSRRSAAPSSVNAAQSVWSYENYFSQEFNQWYAIGAAGPANEAFDGPSRRAVAPLVNNTLFVEFAEHSSVLDEWERYAFGYSCSSEIVWAAGRGANDFFLLLRSRDGLLSAERWQVTVSPGGWEAPRSDIIGSGAPLPVVGTAEARVAGGGEYVKVRERSHFPYVTRKVILENLAIRSDSFAIIPDPDARFVLLASPAGIQQADLVSGVSAFVLDSTDLNEPTESYAMASIGGREGFGRTVETFAGKAYFGPVAIDADNDGVFEAKFSPEDYVQFDQVLPPERLYGSDL